MTSRKIRGCLVLALCLAPACVFDSWGLSPYDVDARGADRRVDQGPFDQAARDRGADLDGEAPDTGSGHDMTSPPDGHVTPDGKPAPDGKIAPDFATFPDTKGAADTKTPPPDSTPPPDKSPATCQALFGTVMGYEICEEKWDRCKFFREEKKKTSCDTICGKHSCLEANNADSGHKCKKDKTSCSNTNSDSNCTCSKF